MMGRNDRRRSASGFTLVELMVVLAIIAILGAIVGKYYGKYVRDSRKAEARTNLAALAMLIEQYNSLYGRYCPDCTDTSNHTYVYKENDSGGHDASHKDEITNWLDFKPKQATDSSVVRYDYQIVANASSTYTITATPVSGRTVAGEILTVDQNGNKTDGTKNHW